MPVCLRLVAAQAWAACRNVRTSSGTFIASREDPDGVLLHVEDKIAALTAIPANHGEVRLPCPAAGLLLPCECD